MTDIKITPIKDRVLAINMEFGEKKTKSGLILSDDDGKLDGIRPRWAEVYKVGSKQKDLKPGDYILVQHGRWTRGISFDIEGKSTKMFMIDYPDGILAISKNKPIELDLVGR